jgi:hypothetical protein
MNEISMPVRLLYYLNVSKEDETLKNIIADQKVFDYFVEMTTGISANTTWDDVRTHTKNIVKLLKEAVK